MAGASGDALTVFDHVVLLVLGAPLAAAIANFLNLYHGERWWGWRAVQRITVGAALVSFLGALWVSWQVLADPAPRRVLLHEWLASGDLAVRIGFLIDSLSALMMLVVTGFAFLIGKFSINYMHRDASFTRYFAAFALFVFAMLVLVMGDNYVLLFVGWEAVGLCSYLLIGHYYERPSAARAGTKAFLMNRVGDAGFLAGLFLIAAHFRTFDYAEVAAGLGGADPGAVTAIALCLLLGAIGKSAQLPLGTWLASAMEGPTPSSALIHAATMVTAGVYLIVRSHGLYDMAPDALLAVAIVGAATALYGALAGQATSDIKGILAASTTTQLGLMFLACGLGAYAVAVFHLVAHAFLKSYLFLTAPSILHHLHGHADPAKAGAQTRGLPSGIYLPVLALCTLLVAVPLVLRGLGEGAPFAGLGPSFWVLVAGGLTAAFAAVHYALNLSYKVFIEDEHGGGEHGAGRADHVSLPFVFVAGAAALGLLLGLLPGGLDNTWFHALLKPIVAVSGPPGAGSLALSTLLAALLALLLAYAWFTALFLDRFKAELPGLEFLKLRTAYSLALNRFWLDDLYGRYVAGSATRLGAWLERFDSTMIGRPTIPGAAGTVPAHPAATWEEQYLSARAEGASVPDAANAAQRREEQQAGEPRDLVGAGLSAVSAWSAAFAAAFAGGFERALVGRVAGWFSALTDGLAGLGGWFERALIGRAAGGFGALTDGLARLGGRIEVAVFDAGVHEGVPRAGGMAGRLMLGIENAIGHPIAAGIIVAAAVLGAFLAG